MQIVLIINIVSQNEPQTQRRTCKASKTQHRAQRIHLAQLWPPGTTSEGESNKT